MWYSSPVVFVTNSYDINEITVLCPLLIAQRQACTAAALQALGPGNQ